MNARRTIAIAGCALLVIAASIGAWFSHVGAISSLLDQDAATVRALAQSPDTLEHPERMLRGAMLPGVHVRFIGSDGTVYDGHDGIIERHTAPMGEPPPFGGPPGSMPGGPPSPIAADLAHIPPRSIATEVGNVVLLPDAPALTHWLVGDVAATIAGLALLGGIVLLSLREESRRTRIVEAARNAREAEYRRFLADAGHELKTPLTIVTGYIDVLSERLRSGDERERRILNGLHSETKRMRELVEKLLLLSRLDARASVPQFVDVATIARTVADETRERFADRTIETAVGIGANIVADPHDLEAAVRNLVENALRYAPDSPIMIEATRHADRVLLSVIDRGPGVDESESDAIFSRFYRGRERTDAQGSGLGLAIVRGVAERWDGTVRLASRDGQTSFTLDFPLAEETEA